MSRNPVSLPITGKYTLQIAALKASVSNFTLKLGLDIPNSSFQSSVTKFSQGFTPVDAQNVSEQKKSLNENSKLGIEAWWMDIVIIPIIINMITSVLLALFGWSQLKSVKEIIEDRKIDQEYADLKKFFRRCINAG